MFVSGITDNAAKILGKRRGTNRESWLSCETWDLIDERRGQRMHETRQKSHQD